MSCMYFINIRIDNKKKYEMFCLEEWKFVKGKECM